MFVSDLTSGKIYDVLHIKEVIHQTRFGVNGGQYTLGVTTVYLVENDNGVENYYSSGFFRDLRKNELREEKLKELGL